MISLTEDAERGESLKKARNAKKFPAEADSFPIYYKKKFVLIFLKGHHTHGNLECMNVKFREEAQKMKKIFGYIGQRYIPTKRKK